LLKNASPEELIHGVRVVAAGDALLAPSGTRRLIADIARPPGHGGWASNAEPADRLILCEGTIKTHVSQVFTKLNLRDRYRPLPSPAGAV
jgi:DNA-binding NarL/FixJ family response regulator